MISHDATDVSSFCSRYLLPDGKDEQSTLLLLLFSRATFSWMRLLLSPFLSLSHSLFTSRLRLLLLVCLDDIQFRNIDMLISENKEKRSLQSVVSETGGLFSEKLISQLLLRLGNGTDSERGLTVYIS